MEFLFSFERRGFFRQETNQDFGQIIIGCIFTLSGEREGIVQRNGELFSDTK